MTNNSATLADAAAFWGVSKQHAHEIARGYGVKFQRAGRQVFASIPVSVLIAEGDNRSRKDKSLSLSEAARFLWGKGGESKKHRLKRAADSGALKCLTIAGRRRYLRTALNEWARSLKA